MNSYMKIWIFFQIFEPAAPPIATDRTALRRPVKVPHFLFGICLRSFSIASRI